MKRFSSPWIFSHFFIKITPSGLIKAQQYQDFLKYGCSSNELGCFERECVAVNHNFFQAITINPTLSESRKEEGTWSGVWEEQITYDSVDIERFSTAR